MNQDVIGNDLIIDMNDVVWKREGRLILDHINWQVRKGEHWAIVGLNGSGKTSLLNMAAGYLWPSSGTIHILGKRLGKYDLRELRKSIGWVSSSLGEMFQVRSGDTTLDVVISGKFASIGIYNQFSEDEVERAWQLLRQFHVDHVADKPYLSLSQGEKQKVMLARAWMANPELIILDEPCGGLDVRMREEFLQTIEEMAGSKEAPTLIYVTHHIEELVPSISHSILLRSGKTVAQGEKMDVITEQLLSETLQIPLQVQWKNQRAWVSVD